MNAGSRERLPGGGPRLEQLVRRDQQVTDAPARGVAHCVGHGRGRAHNAELADPLRAERAGAQHAVRVDLDHAGASGYAEGPAGGSLRSLGERFDAVPPQQLEELLIPTLRSPGWRLHAGLGLVAAFDEVALRAAGGVQEKHPSGV